MNHAINKIKVLILLFKLNNVYILIYYLNYLYNIIVKCMMLILNHLFVKKEKNTFYYL